MRTNPDVHRLIQVESDSELHNIVALTPQKKLFQVVVEKEHSAGAPPSAPAGTINRGDYRGAVKLEPTDKPSRLVRSLAGESVPDSSESYQSGMAFGILPLRRDPTPANGSSYLLNARRLNPGTVWSYGPWNAAPDVPENLRVDREILLVAKADGQIVKIDLSAAQALDPSDLDRNPDVWRLLRNGLVVGKVEYNDGTSKKKSVSLINLASFGDSKDTDLAPQEAFTGTWDFKWPRGSAIRVCLKGGTPEAQSEVKKLASEWLSADPSQNPGRLSFVFLEPNGPADTDYDVLVHRRRDTLNHSLV